MAGRPSVDETRARRAQHAANHEDVDADTYVTDVDTLLWELDRYRLLLDRIEEALAAGETST